VAAISEVLLGLKSQFQKQGKPLIAEFQGGEECAKAILQLRTAGIPAYATPERAAGAMVALRNYASLKERLQAVPEGEALSVR
jgi:acyl-CoA synthetase (NDP forming)